MTTTWAPAAFRRLITEARPRAHNSAFTPLSFVRLPPFLKLTERVADVVVRPRGQEHVLGRRSASAASVSALKRAQLASGVAVPPALRSANGHEFSVATNVAYPARRAARKTGSVYWPACESPTSAINPRPASACHTHGSWSGALQPRV